MRRGGAGLQVGRQAQSRDNRLASAGPRADGVDFMVELL